MSLPDWLQTVVFGPQTKMAIWVPLLAYSIWLGLVRVFRVHSPKTRFWSLLALFALLPLAFVVPILSNLLGDMGKQLINIPTRITDLPPLVRLVIIWPFVLIPLGMAGALGLGLLEYCAAALWLWRKPKRLIDGIFVLDTPGHIAFTFGLLRPRIFVSKSVWESSYLAAVLAHERAHVLRRDPFLLFWARAIRRSTLYLPFGGQWFQELHLEAERACDEVGVKAVGLKPYAMALLDFAQSTPRRAPPTALAFGAEWTLALLPFLQFQSTRTHSSRIGQRLEALLKPSPQVERSGWFWLWFCLTYWVILLTL